MSGMYVIFEGNDGAGKTTTMKAVSEELKRRHPGYEPLLTHHPGSTPLGKHLRQLVKYPSQIDPSIIIDDLSRQMLYMVDAISFTKTLLEPALQDNRTVFADRSSYISALVYGFADGLSINEISRLFDIYTPPKADRLYVLQCPWSISKERTKERGELDHYDSKSMDFYNRVETMYSTLLSGPAEKTMLVSKSVALSDVKYIDTSWPVDTIVQTIVDDLEFLAGEIGALAT